MPGLRTVTLDPNTCCNNFSKSADDTPPKLLTRPVLRLPNLPANSPVVTGSEAKSFSIAKVVGPLVRASSIISNNRLTRLITYINREQCK